MQDHAEPEIRDGTLSIGVELANSCCTLSLSGELDLANAKTLATQLERAEQSGAALVVLDMTKLDFIDSSGIALLVSAHRRLNGGRDALRLVGSDNESVRRVMSLTGLDDGLPFVT